MRPGLFCGEVFRFAGGHDTLVARWVKRIPRSSGGEESTRYRQHRKPLHVPVRGRRNQLGMMRVYFIYSGELWSLRRSSLYTRSGAQR